ncbi:MAG: radical SAM protein [Lachnospiraceae bacterium]|nr:radical SAM protein [Lachnospiraceae bacterium]
MQWDGLSEAPCNLCPRECRVDRRNGQKGFCMEDDRIHVARAALHMWEEPCISGTDGSGAVFFSGCSLRCAYCQNHEIAAGKRGAYIPTRRLSEIMLELQEKGAANINLVTPDHYVIQVSEAVLKAKDDGLTIPVVYNCSGYAKKEVIRNLSGIVDVFLTDFKYMDSELAANYSSAPDYPEVAKSALEEMVYITEKAIAEDVYDGCMKRAVDITPTTMFDKKGMMQKGVIVRHLLLPGHKRNAKDVIRYVYETYGDRVYLSLMNQYTPMFGADCRTDYPELCRKVTKREYDDVVDYAIGLGVKNAFIQEGDTAKESFVPEFDGEGV